MTNQSDPTQPDKTSAWTERDFAVGTAQHLNSLALRFEASSTGGPNREDLFSECLGELTAALRDGLFSGALLYLKPICEFHCNNGPQLKWKPLNWTRSGEHLIDDIQDYLTKTMPKEYFEKTRDRDLMIATTLTLLARELLTAWNPAKPATTTVAANATDGAVAAGPNIKPLTPREKYVVRALLSCGPLGAMTGEAIIEYVFKEFDYNSDLSTLNSAVLPALRANGIPIENRKGAGYYIADPKVRDYLTKAYSPIQTAKPKG